MLRRTYDNQLCSIARTLEVVGERWTFLIIRDALLGANRFDTFLTSLGIARNVLTDRLNSLVEHGVFERVPYQDRPLRYEYRLTTKGHELTSIILSLMEWGDRHHAGEAGPPRVAEHCGCGGKVRIHVMCGKCSRSLAPGEVTTLATARHPATRATLSDTDRPSGLHQQLDESGSHNTR